LKRKQPEPSSNEDAPSQPQSQVKESPKDDEPSVTTTYLSGRNYDVETRGPKLGFESAPNADKDTLEVRAAALQLAHNDLVLKEEEEKETPIDLFKLQPKKPNWDLKRDLKERTAVLDVRTKNAIARLVRERLEAEKKRKTAEGRISADGEDAAVPLEGGELLEAVHVRERQEEEERRREREEDEEVA
jgi:coiled-coil domain-containing protein 12